MTDSHLMPIFNRLPVAFAHGQGVWLTDVDGKTYLDALAGIAVMVSGTITRVWWMRCKNKSRS